MTLAAVAFLLLLPGVLYVLAVLRVDGQPKPADPSAYDPKTLMLAWTRCGETSSFSIQPLNPWIIAGRFIFGDARSQRPGELAAWQIARAHNVAHQVGSNFWWHLSGASLTVWITRQWSAEQIAATIESEGLCT
jgi:hypothetical protein